MSNITQVASLPNEDGLRQSIRQVLAQYSVSAVSPDADDPSAGGMLLADALLSVFGEWYVDITCPPEAPSFDFRYEYLISPSEYAQMGGNILNGVLKVITASVANKDACRAAKELAIDNVAVPMNRFMEYVWEHRRPNDENNPEQLIPECCLVRMDV